ncbi:MAG: ankyrin repeat domain-containing protein [Deinococcus sp.]
MSEPTAFFQAIQAGDAATVTDLVEARAELLEARSPSGLSPVLFAAYYKRPEIAALLVELGAPLTPHEAAAAGAGERLAALLDHDPGILHQPSPDGFSLLGLCAFLGHAELAHELLGRGAGVNEPSRNPMRVTPLHSAVAGDHAGLALLLLEAGAEVNAVQHGGFTPLMSAARNGNLTLVRALLERGAHAGARNDEGRSARELALEEGHAEVAGLLAGPPG